MILAYFVELLCFAVSIERENRDPSGLQLTDGKKIGVGTVLGDKWTITKVLEEEKDGGSVFEAQSHDDMPVIVEVGRPAKIHRMLQVAGVTCLLPIIFDNPRLDYVVSGAVPETIFETMSMLNLQKLPPSGLSNVLGKVIDAIRMVHSLEVGGLGISPTRLVTCHGDSVCFLHFGNAKLFLDGTSGSCWDRLFCSLGEHESKAASRGDDWESLIYIHLYLRWRLPWEIRVPFKPIELSEVMEQKRNLVLDEIKGFYLNELKNIRNGVDTKDFGTTLKTRFEQIAEEDFQPPGMGEVIGSKWIVEAKVPDNDRSTTIVASYLPEFHGRDKQSNEKVIINCTSSQEAMRKKLKFNRATQALLSGSKEAMFQGCIVIKAKGPSLRDFALARGATQYPGVPVEYDAFKTETLQFIGRQVFSQLEELHKVGSDFLFVTPDNIAVGVPNTKDANKIYLTDTPIGHTVFAPAISEEKNSWKAALESAVYTLIYLGLGSMPWLDYTLEEFLKKENQPEAVMGTLGAVRLMDMKLRINQKVLDPLAPQFIELLLATRRLRMESTPDFTVFHKILDTMSPNEPDSKFPSELLAMEYVHLLETDRFREISVPLEKETPSLVKVLDTNSQLYEKKYRSPYADRVGRLSKSGCKGIPIVKATALSADFQKFYVVTKGYPKSLNDLVLEGPIERALWLEIGHQLVDLLKCVHDFGWVLPGLAPFSLAWDEGSKTLYLTEFSGVQEYRRPISKQHLPYGISLDVEHKKPGHFIFGSLSWVSGLSPSRRGSMESFAYTMAYLGVGCLPWSKFQKEDDIMWEKYRLVQTQEFHGLPPGLYVLWDLSRRMSHEEKPDYGKFHEVLDEMKNESFGDLASRVC